MDYTTEDFLKYKQYLNTIAETLNTFFEDQKEYICCKEGCAHCCEHGQYPVSDIEFKYMLLGLFKIETQERMEVIRRIKALKEEYKNCENKKDFMHKCPFLSDTGNCLIYDFRGLICRIFGLITIHESGEYSLPFCHELGLNYSKVYNPKTKRLDYNKIKELGYKKMPNAHKTNLKRLMSSDFFTDEPINFGEIKPLIEWL